MSIYII